jgi:Mrp family chromosome partitioning ATPase
MVDVVKYPDSPGAEAFRKLRMSVMFEALASVAVPEDPLGGAYGPIGPAPVAREVQRAQGTGGRAIVLVVSAGNEPSRPHVAANLAAIYAESGQRVAVISTGSVESGLPVVIHGSESNEIRPEDVAARLEPSRLPNVFRIPLDSFIGNSGQLVMRAPSLLTSAASLVDLVIVETPPLLAVHHAEALSHAVDAVLVVAECRVTTFDEARRAGDRLRRIEAPVLGIVLTNVNVPRNDIRQAVPRRQPEGASQADPDKEPAFVVSGGSGAAQEPTTP